MKINVKTALVLQQLAALGYTDGDPVFLRFFYPTNDPRKDKDAGRKLTGKFPDLPWSQIEQYQNDGRGCYFVVNGGGDKDKEVAQGKAIFYEHDNLSKELSAALWQQLGLPEPTFQVDTGGKSIHSYWVFDEPIGVGEWKALQTDLLNFADGDRSLKNPSRVMRLAGAFHLQVGRDPIQSTILACSGQRYSFDQLRGLIPGQTAIERPRQATAFSGQFIPLTAVLAINHRDLIERGAGDGARNSTGFELACDLLGCEGWLQASGVNYEGSAEGLFREYCDRCLPPIDEVEYRELWRKVEKRNPTPCLSVDKLINCVSAWQRKENASSVLGGGLPKFNTSVEKRQHSANGNTHKNQGAQVVAVSECCSVATQREINVFEQSQANGSAKFNAHEYLPSVLAAKIINDAALANIDPVVIWQYLMPMISSFMGNASGVCASDDPEESAFFAPNIIWSLILNPSGTGKTRGKKAVLAPVDRWQAQATQTFKDEYEEWKSSQAKKPTKENPNPENKPKPIHRKYVFNIATPQAIVKRLGEQTNGSALIRDELKGLFKSLDQFSSEGEGLDVLIESWDGAGTAVDRVDEDNSYYVPESRLSIGGGLQPGVFQKVFSDPDDSQGVLARFLIAIPPQLPVKRQRGKELLANYLPLLYSWISNQKWGTVYLSSAANDFFTTIYESFANEKTPNEASRAWMAKLSGQTLRMALVLHALECYCEQSRRSPKVIELDTLQKAHKLALYYKSCFYSLQGTVTNDISGVLAKIQKRAEAASVPLAMADFYRHIRAIKILALEEKKQIREVTVSLCKELEALGKGRICIKNNKEFYAAANVENSTTCSTHVASQNLGTKDDTEVFQHFNTPEDGEVDISDAATNTKNSEIPPPEVLKMLKNAQDDLPVSDTAFNNSVENVENVAENVARIMPNDLRDILSRGQTSANVENSAPIEPVNETWIGDEPKRDRFAANDPYGGPAVGATVKFDRYSLTSGQSKRLAREGDFIPWGCEGVVDEVIDYGRKYVVFVRVPERTDRIKVVQGFFNVLQQVAPPPPVSLSPVSAETPFDEEVEQTELL